MEGGCGKWAAEEPVQIWIKGQIQEYFSSLVNIKRFFHNLPRFNLDEKIPGRVVGGYL